MRRTVISPSQLAELAELVVEENRRRQQQGRKALFLLYDQVYWTLTFGGARHVTPVELVPACTPYVIMLDAISKSIASTGLRVGWAVAPPPLIARMRDFLGHVGAWAPRAEQIATAKLLDSGAERQAWQRAFLHQVELRLDALYARVREEIAATPGVEAVGTAAFPMFYNIQLLVGITVLSADEQVADSVAQANPAMGPGFFDAASIPLRAGRDFTAADLTASPNVVIVNESFARKFGLGDKALGTTLRLEGRYVPQTTVEIVGVVGDAKYSAIKPDIAPQVFVPRAAGDAQFVASFYYVRASIDPGALVRVVPEIMKRVDPNIPASNLTAMRWLIDSRMRGDSVMTTLSSTFAGLATVLAAIGLYAVLAFSVTQRKRELGLRLALGAQPSRLRSLVLAQVARLAAVVGGVGLLLAFAVGRLAQASLHGLSGYDPLVFVSAIGGLALVVAVASWLPALRASNVAPMEALRHE